MTKANGAAVVASPRDAMRFIDAHRQDQSVSGNKIAALAGVSEQAYSAAVAGKNSPRLGNLFAMCDALGLRILLIHKDVKSISFED